MKYTGACHCKAVTYEFEGEVKEGLTCNCSICHAKGTVLHFLPRANVKVTGEEGMTTYKFNKNTIAHKFCPVCGVQPFGVALNNGVEFMAINLRTVDGLDLDTIKINKYNGKDL
jgi:hypothetical protein